MTDDRAAPATDVQTTEPVRLGTVDASPAGGRPKVLLGDLTGDGRMELLFVQGDDIDATHTPHEVASLTAIDLDAPGDGPLSQPKRLATSTLYPGGQISPDG